MNLFARLWPGRARGYAGIVTLAPVLIVLVLAAFFPPDGQERAEWLQFVGRFHPLIVHFPIALILLVPILELAGRRPRFADLSLATDLVLGLAMAGAALAVVLGWCLAQSGGFSGPVVTQHMWAGIALAAVSWLCWMLRPRSAEQGFGIYPAALAIAVGLVTFTGYRGGQLSFGENHLTEHMPAAMRGVLGISTHVSTPADANTFYGARIEPIFAARCLTCHSPAKHKGDLRLDSYASLIRGGKNGPIVTAGNTQSSELLRRVSLPPDHDDFMPKESKRPLSPDQVKLIELWIAAGASDTLAIDAIKGAPENSTSPGAPAEVIFPDVDLATVTKLRSQTEPALAKLQKQFPNILEYESRGSADLQLNASILGPKFGDSDLASLAPLAEQITVADFSRTAITDNSAAAIAAMKRLRVLRLMNTQVTDTTVKGLGALDQLESLNVFGTAATPASFPVVAKLPKLKYFYAGQTAIPPEVALPEALKGKIIF